MKLLTVCTLLCAVMALASATREWYGGQSSASCPCGWTEYYDRCFIYVSRAMSWAEAQRNCESMNANLGSAHSLEEYQLIQRVIFDATQSSGETWIGGSDAQQEEFWFWIDGTRFTYSNWCTGQPDDLQDRQDCLKANFSDKNCWDDGGCEYSLPSVCAKQI